MGNALSEIFGGVGGFGGFMGSIKTVGYILIGLVILVICGGILWFMIKKRRNWNIKAEIKIARSDGKLITAEWGKAEYNSKRGVVYIKRKKAKPVPMKPFNTSRFLQGSNILTVVQLSPGQYVPVLPESFLEMKDDKTGQEASMCKLAADFSESKSWRNSFEREAKLAFSIKNLLRDYAPYISIGLVIFLWGIQFFILYNKIT